MPEAGFIVLLLAFPLIGAAVRRWFVVLLPMVGWPLFYVGLAGEWWGYGVGDGWQFVAVLFTAIGTAATALAVLLGRTVKEPSHHPRG
jgi:hypothetical protein